MLTTDTANFIRKLLVMPKDERIDLGAIDIKGNKVYYDNTLMRDNLSDLDAETLLVILGEKNKFRCLYADQLECKSFLKFVGLNEKQVKAVIKEKNNKKRNDLFIKFIQDYDQNLQKEFKSTIFPQRSLYHSMKKPLYMTADHYVDCTVCGSKAGEKCAIITTFNAKEEDAMPLLQKIRNLLRLDQWEEAADKIEKSDLPARLYIHEVLGKSIDQKINYKLVRIVGKKLFYDKEYIGKRSPEKLKKLESALEKVKKFWTPSKGSLNNYL